MKIVGNAFGLNINMNEILQKPNVRKHILFEKIQILLYNIYRDEEKRI